MDVAPVVGRDRRSAEGGVARTHIEAGQALRLIKLERPALGSACSGVGGVVCVRHTAGLLAWAFAPLGCLG